MARPVPPWLADGCDLWDAPDGFDMAGWANLVMAELDRRKIERAIFVGDSMSGRLTEQIWRDNPRRVLGIGLAGATQRPATPNDQQQFAELMDRIAHDWRAMAPRSPISSLDLDSEPPTRNGSVAGPTTSSATSSWWAMARLLAAINHRPDYTSSTGGIDVSATVIHGTDDGVFPGDCGPRPRPGSRTPTSSRSRASSTPSLRCADRGQRRPSVTWWTKSLAGRLDLVPRSKVASIADGRRHAAWRRLLGGG